MLGDDEDVFDSVTWESPNTHPHEFDEPIHSRGPGFRQTTFDSNEDPLQPKWEGYLLTSVRDPVKELAETKDAYVSYLVSAKVFRLLDFSRTAVYSFRHRQTCRDSPPLIRPREGVSKTLCFCETILFATFLRVSYPLSPINIALV